MTGRFDRIVWGVIGLLVVLIALTVLAGDRVGVQVLRVFPLGDAHSTDNVVIQFSSRMARDSVGERLTISPAVAGDVLWQGDTTLVFSPSEPFASGQTYTVTLNEGVESIGGRRVIRDHQFVFSVGEPQVAYLYPADGYPQNIWMARPDEPDSATQITFSQSGVFDYAVSPDGRSIAFSERRTDRPATDIKLLSLDDGTVTNLTNCEDSDCTSPVWRPDGRMLAYTRVDMNTLLPNVGVSPYRVWLLDLTTTPISTYPLFDDSQVLGYGPEWALNGQRITLFDSSVPGVVVYDFSSDDYQLIASDHGTSGVLSPDGELLVFPEIVFDGSRAWSRLMVATLETETLSPLTPDGEPLEDSFAHWSPDGELLAVGRRYRDERYTPTVQIHLVDPETGEGEPLINDTRYNNGFLEWLPDGQQIVLQRFPQFTETGETNRNGRPEVWTVDIATGELQFIADNAMYPRWIP